VNTVRAMSRAVTLTDLPHRRSCAPFGGEMMGNGAGRPAQPPGPTGMDVNESPAQWHDLGSGGIVWDGSGVTSKLIT
jgi:hypothetical protein